MIEVAGMKISNKVFGSIVTGIVAFTVLMSTFGINDNGYRTVVQLPNGTTFVKMDPGMYITAFGSETVYPDIITHDLDGEGVSVRYQDGGKGKVDGVVRISLPTDEASMLILHKAVRSQEGLRNKLVYPEVKQALMLTAGLMTSEEAYTQRRADFANWATDQIQEGRYDTVMKDKTVTMQDGTKQTKKVPVIKVVNGIESHQESPIKGYGMRVQGFQITDWSFEKDTENQIKTKRGAEMAIITARANADKAVWEQKEIKANGEREVERAKQEQLKLKETATIQAERKKEVAVIAAELVREVNEQKEQAAIVDVRTAKQEALAVKARADAEAYKKKAILLADGALKQKLATYEKVMGSWANAYANRKVPQFQMGSAGGEDLDSNTSQFQDMLSALIAKDLVFDSKLNK